MAGAIHGVLRRMARRHDRHAGAGTGRYPQENPAATLPARGFRRCALQGRAGDQSPGDRHRIRNLRGQHANRRLTASSTRLSRPATQASRGNLRISIPPLPLSSGNARASKANRRVMHGNIAHRSLAAPDWSMMSCISHGKMRDSMAMLRDCNGNVCISIVILRISTGKIRAPMGNGLAMQEAARI